MHAVNRRTMVPERDKDIRGSEGLLLISGWGWGELCLRDSHLQLVVTVTLRGLDCVLAL